jgi:hypothetical protein
MNPAQRSSSQEPRGGPGAQIPAAPFTNVMALGVHVSGGDEGKGAEGRGSGGGLGLASLVAWGRREESETVHPAGGLYEHPWLGFTKITTSRLATRGSNAPYSYSHGLPPNPVGPGDSSECPSLVVQTNIPITFP